MKGNKDICRKKTERIKHGQIQNAQRFKEE